MKAHDQRVWKWTCRAGLCHAANVYVCEPEDAAGAVDHGVDDKCVVCGAKVELRLQGTNGGTADVKRRVA